MRTTLTLDDDLAEKLKEIAHERRIAFRQVVNETLRRGLSAQQVRASRKAPFEVRTFGSAFRAGVDPHKLNQLGDELEAQRRPTRSSR